MQKEINIQKLAYGGEGIGKLDGKICFIKNALPDERVLAKIFEDKKKFSRGRAVKILQPSPSRIPAPCEYVDACGGCQYQHVSYEEELRWKEIQVREYFQKQLTLEDSVFGPIVRSPEPYGYRNSVSLHVEKGKTGFISEDNESLVEIKKCLLAHPALNSIFTQTLKSNGSFRLSAENKIIPDTADQFFEIQLGEIRLTSHSRAFIQNNSAITCEAGAVLKRELKRLSPNWFTDLYSGLGTFSFLAADEIPHILCAEENPFAVQALHQNKKKAGKDITVLEGPVEKTFPKWLRQNPAQEMFIFLDPPRKGISPEFAKFLGSVPARGLGYLSCHLGTQIRDLDLILNSGKWAVRKVLPFDMFPRTKHIEILALLEPK